MKIIKRIRQMRESVRHFERNRNDAIAFEGIIRASYRPNIGRVLPGEIPVIAPRPSDFEGEQR